MGHVTPAEFAATQIAAVITVVSISDMSCPDFIYNIITP
jgi:hypothetical protein